MDKQTKQVIADFTKRLVLTGCTDVQVRPMRNGYIYDAGQKVPRSADGRYIISAVAPKWGMGDRGWKGWSTTRDLRGYRHKVTGQRTHKVPNYQEYNEWAPILGPKRTVKRRVYYQFWPKGYVNGEKGIPTTRPSVRSRWDLAPAGLDGRYHCYWCRKRFLAKVYTKHLGKCPVLSKYMDTVQSVRKELYPESLLTGSSKLPDETYEQAGARQRKQDDHIHAEALRRARA